MTKKNYLILFLYIVLSTTAIYSQTLKAAVINGPNEKDTRLFEILSEKSEIIFELQYMDLPEAQRALKDGIVDIAILPDNEQVSNVALIQTPLYTTTYALIGKSGFPINEYNLISIKTIGVYSPDEYFLIRDLINRYSIEPRIQLARHYDSLIRIITTGRVSAVFVPIDEFEKGLIRMNEERSHFSNPFILNNQENFLVVSKRRADNVAPLMDRLDRILENMKKDGSFDELITAP